MLSGEVRLYDGREWITARPGDFLYVPEGGIHGFRGADRASMLLMFAPGGPREDYFETLARGEEMSEEQRDAFMQRHDTFWL
ncbi:MAG: cupin domain-containing protein [Angustibacter sp.]